MKIKILLLAFGMVSMLLVLNSSTKKRFIITNMHTYELYSLPGRCHFHTEILMENVCSETGTGTLHLLCAMTMAKMVMMMMMND